MSDVEQGRTTGRTLSPGEVLLSALLALIAVVLLAQFGEQTRISKRAAIWSQPGFWSGVGLVLMAVGAAAHGWNRWRHRGRAQPLVALALARDWLRPLEYAGWFLTYVYATTLLGYLPATVLFCVSLAFRTGVRQPRVLAAMAGVAVLLVVVFKALLRVNVPGGALYDWLPPPVAAFFIAYL